MEIYIVIWNWMKFKSIFFIKIFVSFLNLYTNYIYYIADRIKQILIYIRTKYIIIWNEIVINKMDDSFQIVYFIKIKNQRTYQFNKME